MANKKEENFITSTCHKKKSTKNGKNREPNGDFAHGNTLSVGHGRPPVFKTPVELAEKIDSYINDCPDTKTCYSSDGVEYEKKIPTISGMAFFLGFESRQSMYDYEKKGDGFSYIIKRARLWLERHYEQSSQGNSPTGPIFVLKNMGWSDKQEVDNNIKIENIEVIPPILKK